MKFFNLLIIFTVVGYLFSCSGNGYSGKEIKTKDEYFEFKNQVRHCSSSFDNDKLSEKEYSRKMESFGDIYVISKESIPPERRYKGAIYCYKEAIKHDVNNQSILDKLNEQETLYQVIN